MSYWEAVEIQEDPKEFWSWLVSLNWAAIGRALYYVWFVDIAINQLRQTWQWGYFIYQRWGWFPYLIGIGEFVVFFIGVGVVCLLASIPYLVYLYSHEKRLGGWANAGLNFAAWAIAALLRFLMWEVLWWLVTGRFPIQDV